MKSRSSLAQEENAFKIGGGSVDCVLPDEAWTVKDKEVSKVSADGKCIYRELNHCVPGLQICVK